MGKSAYPLSFILANMLYKNLYPVYKPLYFSYKKIMEKNEIALFTRLITPGMTVLDIGGNIGYYAMLFSRLTGDSGKVFVFEPDITNFAHLKSNVFQLKNVVPNNCAVGDSTRTVRLYRSDELNVDHQTYDSGENRPFTEVSCIAIDDYFRNGETVDFIKIDIQGYDYFALKGMTETVRRSLSVKIFGEFWPYGLNKAGVRPLDYLRLLRDMGFVLKMEKQMTEEDYEGQVNNNLFYTNFYGEKQ